MTLEFKLPDLGEGIHEGEVLTVHVSEGDSVSEGDALIEVETDKAAVEIPSPYTARVEKILVKTGDMVRVGDVLITFQKKTEQRAESEQAEKAAENTTAAEKATPAPAKPVEQNMHKPAKDRRPVPASPATRRLARELGVDLYEVRGSGPEGLVTAQDVKNSAEKPATPTETPPQKTPAPSPEAGPETAITPKAPQLPDFSRWGVVEKVPVRSIRRATARQMALAWSQVPHVSNQDAADITRLEELRTRQKGHIAEKGGKLTLTVFVLKAAVSALKSFPYFNASFDAEAGEIILKKYYHIGVAANTEAGLVVPVIRDVDRKSITELAVELAAIARRARDRKLLPEEMQGGTFTITNAGAMGGGHFSPIVNYPEVAILGTGQARMQPVVKQENGSEPRIVPRLMMPIVLCFDHRIQDGVNAIRFTRTIIDALEDPEALFMTMA